MGRDKSEIRYREKPQYQVLHDLLSMHCESVFLSRRRGQVIPTAIPVIMDQFTLDGPLNGLLSAFKSNPLNDWISIPCDMPLVDQALLLYLIANRNKNKVATCFYDSDKKYPEPLLTLWERTAGPLLLDFYRKGGFSPRKFLMENDIEIIEVPDSHKLLNVNTPEELSLLLSLSKEKTD